MLSDCWNVSARARQVLLLFQQSIIAFSSSEVCSEVISRKGGGGKGERWTKARK